MARADPPDKAPPDVDAINLSRVLSRLEQKILSPNPSTRLQRSSYERTKTAANLEYARTLLLRLEHHTSGIKVQSRKQAAQASLAQQRTLIKRLNDRLYELNQQDEGFYSSSSDDEDLLGPINSPLPPRTPLTSTLNRRKAPTTSQLEATSTLSPAPTSTTTAHTLSTPASTTATLLEAASTEHANLTSLLVSQAAALKASSLAFSADLAADKLAVDGTEAALGKNKDGMDSATRRMGLLSRMTEGKYWWERIVLYFVIMALWVLALVIVFVMPKLRF